MEGDYKEIVLTREQYEWLLIKINDEKEAREELEKLS